MKNFKTYDLLIAAVLEYNGFQCSLFGDPTGMRCSFVFDYSGDEYGKIKSLVEDFWKEELLVEPKKFNSIIRTLKSRTKEINLN